MAEPATFLASVARQGHVLKIELRIGTREMREGTRAHRLRSPSQGLTVLYLPSFSPHVTR